MTTLLYKARPFIALALCHLWPVSLMLAQQGPSASVQQDAIAPVRPHAPILWRPYLAAEVPAARLSNSGRIRDLIRAGKLYLTAQDAVALALENNVDIEVARYNSLSLEWSLERSEAGGSLPGVPSGATQANSVVGGQGVLGSQAAAGVTAVGSANSRNTGNAQISQVGPVAQTFDPSIQQSTVFSHKTVPQPNAAQTISSILIENSRIYSGSYQQGFSTGGSINVSYNNEYLNENAPTDVLNPSVAPTLSVSVQQNLLRNFGKAVNTRQITIARMNFQNSDLNFRSQLTTTVAAVLNAYYALSGDYEDLKAKQSAHEAANTLLEDSKKQVQLGSLADIDLITAESQVSSTQQDLVNSQVALDEQQRILKNLISRNGLADPLLESVQIVPLDSIVIPATDDIPPVKDMIQRALINRTDLTSEKASIATSEVSALGTRSGLLPSVQAFAGTSHAGLSGKAQPALLPNGQIISADPYFVGGVGTALGQIFRRDFPTENVGVFASVPVNNRQAQADYGIDQLQLRQSELSNAKDLKQAQVDVLNAVVALRQARARYDAATHAHTLDQQLLDAERRKFQLGASTPYAVIQQQRDLVVAQATETAALVTYSNARVNLDATVGSVLETNHISIAEARNGRVARVSVVPANLPN